MIILRMKSGTTGSMRDAGLIGYFYTPNESMLVRQLFKLIEDFPASSKEPLFALERRLRANICAAFVAQEVDYATSGSKVVDLLVCHKFMSNNEATTLKILKYGVEVDTPNVYTCFQR